VKAATNISTLTLNTIIGTVVAQAWS